MQPARTRVLVALALTWAHAAFAQPPSGAPLVTPQGGAILEAQRQAYAERQRCIESNATAHQLYIAANEVITLRDNKAFIEQELPHRPSLQAQMPAGYDAFLAEKFARYQANGGTASAVSDVTPVADPCPPPALRVPVRPSPDGASSPIRRSLTIPNPAAPAR